MPRVRNTEWKIRHAFRDLYPYRPTFKFLDQVPADLCWDCYHLKWFDLDTIEHPPYEMQDPPTICIDCGVELGRDDDE